ncbi:aldo/keto reductase [Mucilaginibacter sp. X5P1]|uniref:aldo/keto reductase n=1 Tax=Mucilaginibacter sp. X5P1 TaxID=2723088 RepID=UPI00160ED7C0|nr:aldo/keto reductase [Mucilaginibacter sp. X5P1]MBB6137598.1 aryl-alcohol dehydrogenase-like predicted oxidoreductase [Mucilaginibacter sp. X5P1]
MIATISSTVIIGENSEHPLTAYRPGYGTMRLTGEQIWGEPANRPEALRILKRAVDLGVNYIDTADYYGPGVTNRLIAEALYPYSEDLIIGTKIGAIRKGDKSWNAFSKPGQLRQSVDNNLKELKQEQLSLVHFRFMPGAEASFEESLEAMFTLQKDGKILHVGLSNVSREQLETGLKMGRIASVQNLYGYTQRTTLSGPMGGAGGEEILDLLETHHIPLIPYFSLQTSLGKGQEKIEQMADKYNMSAAQMNITWLLHKSPWILPIPGTTSLAHLEENLKAAETSLSPEDMAFLS